MNDNETGYTSANDGSPRRFGHMSAHTDQSDISKLIPKLTNLVGIELTEELKTIMGKDVLPKERSWATAAQRAWKGKSSGVRKSRGDLASGEKQAKGTLTTSARMYVKPLSSSSMCLKSTQSVRPGPL